MRECWNDLPNHYANVELDAFVVMPNHVHGIIIILENLVGADHDLPDTGAIHESPLPKTTIERRRMLLPKIIGRFKMNSAKRINQIRRTPGMSIWQRNYFEHIIRDDNALTRIRDYIINNPQQWEFDRENTQHTRNDGFPGGWN